MKKIIDIKKLRLSDIEKIQEFMEEGYEVLNPKILVSSYFSPLDLIVLVKYTTL